MPMRSIPLAAVDELLDKLPLKYQAIVAIGVGTGCRITEVLSLRRFDLLTRDGEIKEEIAFLKLKAEKKVKGKKQRRSDRPPVIRHRKMRIPTAFREVVLRHLAAEEQAGYDRPDDYVFRGKMGRHLTRQTAYKVFRKVLGEGHGTHWMRKTFAQEIFKYFLRENPADPMRALELTRKALDHARIDTTVKYLGITATAISDAQESIFAPLSTKEQSYE